jgi:hypothetical protein
MKFHRFELSVIELAHRGMRLTVANVVAHLGTEPAQTEQWLDDMAREGRLDVELDEEQGLIYYRVRGLTPPPAYLAPYVPARVTHERAHKSTKAAALVGLLLPGVGLLYAAPFSAALIAGIATLLTVKMVAVIPLLGPVLSSVALGLCALASALFGVLYARQYNANGRRTHLAAGTPRRVYARAARHASQLVSS